MELPRRQHGADHVRRAHRVPAAGLSGRLLARRQRHLLRPPRHPAGIARALAPRGAARARAGHHGQLDAARDPVLHLHGADPRAQWHGRGPARHHRPALRAGARRPGAGGDLRRRAARGDHRRGGGLGDLHGPDLAADHAALRLRTAWRAGLSPPRARSRRSFRPRSCSSSWPTSSAARWATCTPERSSPASRSPGSTRSTRPAWRS